MVEELEVGRKKKKMMVMEMKKNKKRATFTAFSASLPIVLLQDLAVSLLALS